MKTFTGSWAFFAFFCLLAASCDTSQPQVTNDLLKAPSIDHKKFTEGCPRCHEGDRKAPNLDLVTTPHGFGGDCVQCHSFPDFKTRNASIIAHSPSPTSCLGCHSVVLEAALHPPLGDCVQCHTFPKWK